MIPFCHNFHSFMGTVYKAPNGKYVAEVTLYFYLDSNGKGHRKKKTRTDKKISSDFLIASFYKLISFNSHGTYSFGRFLSNPAKS